MKIKRVSRRFLPYLLIMLVAIVLLWPQLRSHAFISGYDYYFHMSRTYETAMQIKTGHFSYFLSLFSWNHNARIVNALYGPLGGYASGLILLLAHSWLHWELIMSFIALVLAGSTMYSLDHYWRINRYVNFTLSVLYMLSEPISDYVFNQMFAGFGAALLPLLVLLMSEIMTKEDVQPVKFALVLVLIVEIHLMTFILSMILVVTGLLIAIYSAHHTRYQLFKHLCEGTGLMLILSFNVWDSILEVFGSNFHHIIPTFPGTSLGNESYSAILNTYPKASLLQSPSLIGMGVAVLIMITIGWWLITCRHLNWVTNVLMMLGLFSIWVASGYFPWSFVQRYAYSVTTLVQFPKRFLPLGLILIYLVFGIISSKYLKHNNGRKLSRNVILILLLCLIGWGWQNNYETYLSYIRIYNSSQVINWHHYVNMQWQTKRTSNQLRNSLKDDRPGQFLSTVDNPVPDYLPTSITYRQPSQYGRLNPQDKYQRVYYQRIHFKFRTLGHGRELITLPSKNPQTKIIPFAKYAHTRAVLNHHLIKPKVNQVGAMQLHLRTGNNHLLLQYQPSLWFRVGMIVSILMWLWILSCVIYHRFTK